MVLTVTDRWLWLPVHREAPMVKLHIHCEGMKIQEIDIRLSVKSAQYHTAMDMGAYIGKTIEIKGALPEVTLAALRFHTAQPSHDYEFRTRLHYTAETGWINDPNGLVYADGFYHLYHQWNPYGTEWGNMHWGHAVSRDLITWERKPMAMAPDEYGTMYSGCAWPDKENAAGFGKNALLFFYTASGGCNQWSIDRGHQHTQHLAVSLDGGETLMKKGMLIGHIKGGNRDPKVFYHQGSRAYIMVLFLDDYEFAIFRSPDLIHWTESQRFSAEKMRECPDLFELRVDNEPGTSKWVFWSADGYYLTGSFDGYRFTAESHVQSAYSTCMAYAAQTYAGVADRCISIAWHRTANDHGNFRGMMSIPTELLLTHTGNEWRIRFQPVREVWDHFHLIREWHADAHGLQIPMNGLPVMAVLTTETPGTRTLCTGKTELAIPCGESPTILIIDHGIIEYFADGGLMYGTLEAEEDILQKEMTIINSQAADCLKLYEFLSESKITEENRS